MRNTNHQFQDIQADHLNNVHLSRSIEVDSPAEDVAELSNRYIDNNVSSSIVYLPTHSNQIQPSQPIFSDLSPSSHHFDNFHQFSHQDQPNNTTHTTESTPPNNTTESSHTTNIAESTQLTESIESTHTADTDNTVDTTLPTRKDTFDVIQPRDTTLNNSLYCNSKYSQFKHAPVGFDRVALFYRLDKHEKFIDGQIGERLFRNGLYINQQVLGGPGLYISFNATTISNRTAYLPLSLEQYQANLQKVEKLVRKISVKEFSLDRCIISKIEVFKTLKMTQSPTDYARCLKMLEVKGAYKSNYEFMAEGIGTFLIRNGRDEVMLYDKSSQWAKRLEKSNILTVMPDDYMRVEWRIKDPQTAQLRLGFKHFLGILENYDQVVDAYCTQQDSIFHKIERTPRDKVVLTAKGISRLMQSLTSQGIKHPIKIANRMILFYLLDYHGCLDAYVHANKGSAATYKMWQNEKAKYVAQLHFNKSLRWIDLYNELTTSLQNNTEIQHI